MLREGNRVARAHRGEETLRDDSRFEGGPRTPGGRRKRVDAQRNLGALLDAAKGVFARSGVDAPVKEILDAAGVGAGTLYRHFPQRADLVAAVLAHEIDECADAGPALSAAHEPAMALSLWLKRFTEFVATKRGLAGALHSGDPAFEALPGYFLQRLEPVVEHLITSAVGTGTIRTDVTARDLLYAVALLCQPVPGEGVAYNLRMVEIFIDGLHGPTAR